jgi:hypothetical protein
MDDCVNFLDDTGEAKAMQCQSPAARWLPIDGVSHPIVAAVGSQTTASVLPRSRPAKDG